ncbi:helix-turn-helix domain-containing protein [Amaricoccus macauensis]|uniref:helix-turn-helix domain-containing protein n=1 Tax=Amaricoccus macauensis TaxID=57001 RepID=UPI003C7E2766
MHEKPKDRFNSAYYEHITIPPGETCLWRQDDFPWQRTVWNYHPELEIHLIRYSSGIAYVGDYIGGFEPGQVVLVGANLPHNWITPAPAGTRLPERDVVVQFDGNVLLDAATQMPEFGELSSLFERAALGIEFTGPVADEGRRIIEAMGVTTGLARFAHLLDLLARLAACPPGDYRILATKEFRDHFHPEGHQRQAALETALEYIRENFHAAPRLSDVARMVGLSQSAFSRLFKAQTGNTFSEHLNSLRIWTARQMLLETDKPVTDICFEAGFNNISNFNRRFRAVVRMTPSQYRQAARARSLLDGGMTGG